MTLEERMRGILKACECEHAEHEEDKGCWGELYGSVKTPYGVFLLCIQCWKAGHMIPEESR